MKRLLFYINVLVFFGSVLTFYACFISPESWPISGVFSLFAPVFIVLNLLFILVWLFLKKINMLLSVFALVLGFWHVLNSYQITSLQHVEKDDFSVVSYNVRILNVYKYLRTKENFKPVEQQNRLASLDTDVLCLQEYYNMDTSSVFNTNHRISSKFKYFKQDITTTNRKGGQFGLITYSKHPIVSSKILKLHEGSYNGLLSCDIVRANDTIRVYNMHLQSFNLNDGIVLQGKKSKGTFTKLKTGFVERAKQIELLLKDVEKCPYPYIVVGDLNDTPYSYAYRELKNKLKNSFEEAGNGFGFTYRHDYYKLRIDHHFYSSHFKAKRFETLYDWPYSDHFPIKTVFTIEDK